MTYSKDCCGRNFGHDQDCPEARQPRLHPVARDVFKKPLCRGKRTTRWKERTVVMVEEDGLTISGPRDTLYGEVLFKEAELRKEGRTFERIDALGSLHLVSLSTWQRWAEDAEVVSTPEGYASPLPEQKPKRKPKRKKKKPDRPKSAKVKLIGRGVTRLPLEKVTRTQVVIRILKGKNWRFRRSDGRRIGGSGPSDWRLAPEELKRYALEEDCE